MVDASEIAFVAINPCLNLPGGHKPFYQCAGELGKTQDKVGLTKPS
jgi:hypothetical protein